MALRYDIGSLKAPVRCADGRLRVDGYLTRTGVFEYRNPDGSVRREYRPPEEVFNADSLATFELVPLTDNHPPEMVTAQNAKQYAVGATGESVRQDGDRVAASIVVFDAGVIAKLERGKVQLSCGYEADVEDSPGEIDGQRYDAIQRNIRGNHVAIVDVGRAGPDVRIRMDAGIMVTEARTDFIIEDFMEEKLKEALENVNNRIQKLLSIKGHKTVDQLHRELGLTMWDYCGMSRTEEGLRKVEMAQKHQNKIAEAERLMHITEPENLASDDAMAMETLKTVLLENPQHAKALPLYKQLLAKQAVNQKAKLNKKFVFNQPVSI